MQSSSAIQRAHDVLVQVLLDETPIALDDISRTLMAESADVLCWVLEHDPHPQPALDFLAGLTGNLPFAQELRELEATLEEYGMARVDHGHAG